MTDIWTTNNNVSDMPAFKDFGLNIHCKNWNM